MIEKLKKIATDMGCTTKPGIGYEQELFIHDTKGNSVSCVLVENKLDIISNRDIETQDNPEYFTANIMNADEVINAIKKGLLKDEYLK